MPPVNLELVGIFDTFQNPKSACNFERLYEMPLDSERLICVAMRIFIQVYATLTCLDGEGLKRMVLLFLNCLFHFTLDWLSRDQENVMTVT